MGLLSSSANFVRYSVHGELPANFWDFAAERIAAFSFRDIDDNFEERSIGWVAVNNMFDSEFAYASYAAGDYIVLSLRIDERKVSPAVLKKFAGHTQTSSIIGEYQHYGGDDVKEMQLGFAGKETINQDKTYELKKTAIKCPHCGKANPWDAEVCGFCNFVISQQRQVEIEELKKQILKLNEEKKETDKLIKELIKKISQ